MLINEDFFDDNVIIDNELVDIDDSFENITYQHRIKLFFSDPTFNIDYMSSNKTVKVINNRLKYFLNNYRHIEKHSIPKIVFQCSDAFEMIDIDFEGIKIYVSKNAGKLIINGSSLSTFYIDIFLDINFKSFNTVVNFFNLLFDTIAKNTAYELFKISICDDELVNPLEIYPNFFNITTFKKGQNPIEKYNILRKIFTHLVDVDAYRKWFDKNNPTH